MNEARSKGDRLENQLAMMLAPRRDDWPLLASVGPTEPIPVFGLLFTLQSSVCQATIRSDELVRLSGSIANVLAPGAALGENDGTSRQVEAEGEDDARARCSGNRVARPERGSCPAGRRAGVTRILAENRLRLLPLARPELPGRQQLAGAAHLGRPPCGFFPRGCRGPTGTPRRAPGADPRDTRRRVGQGRPDRLAPVPLADR